MGIPGDEASGVSHPIILGSKEFNAAPAAHYDWLRREAPVYKGRLPYVSEQDVYFLSRHQDCVSMLTDPRFRRRVEGAPPLPFPKAIRFLTTDSMILKDDPEHRRLRRLVSKPFTPRAIARLGERVDALTRELLDELEPGREIDLQQAYALPVPITVINVMVGVPEEDRSRFHGWMDLMIEGMAKYGIEKAPASTPRAWSARAERRRLGDRGGHALNSAAPWLKIGGLPPGCPVYCPE